MWQLRLLAERLEHRGVKGWGKRGEGGSRQQRGIAPSASLMTWRRRWSLKPQTRPSPAKPKSQMTFCARLQSLQVRLCVPRPLHQAPPIVQTLVPRRLALLSVISLSAFSRGFAAAASSANGMCVGLRGLWGGGSGGTVPACTIPIATPQQCPFLIRIHRKGLEESKIIPDLVDRMSPAAGAELAVEFHGKAIKVRGEGCCGGVYIGWLAGRMGG